MPPGRVVIVSVKSECQSEYESCLYLCGKSATVRRIRRREHITLFLSVSPLCLYATSFVCKVALVISWPLIPSRNLLSCQLAPVPSKTSKNMDEQYDAIVLGTGLKVSRGLNQYISSPAWPLLDAAPITIYLFSFLPWSL